MRQWRRALVVAMIAITASGCIGATDRADFDAEVRARGGGVSSAWIAESFDAIALSLGLSRTADMQVLTININGSNRTVTAQARRADQPDFVDVVVVKDGEIVASTQVQDADQLPLDDIMFPLGDLPIREIEELSDVALAEFGESDGFVQSISAALRNGEPLITLSLSSARQTGTATFRADGTFVEVSR